MKIGIFTDAHYSSQEVTCGNRYNSKSLEKIRQAYKAFQDEKCDLVVCLGDLTDTEASHEKEIENLKEIANVIKTCPIKSICIMGNHDAFALTSAEFYEILGRSKPEHIKMQGNDLLRLLFQKRKPLSARGFRLERYLLSPHRRFEKAARRSNR